MSEPAPGPWRVVEPYADGFWGILGADGFPVVVLTTVRQPALANARLIAAAPEMYDALVAIQNRVPLKDSLLGGHTCGECRMCFEIAEQVLTKAESREP